MANNFLLILSLLGFIMCSQAMLFSTGLNDTVCKNGSHTVMCNKSVDQKLYPDTCCELGDGYICCEDISMFIGIIVGAIVTFCVVCVFLPLLVVICCCCCFMGTAFGKVSSRNNIVRSGYQRV